MNTREAMKCMEIYKRVAEHGYSVVVSVDDFWIGPENNRLRKIIEAGEEPDMLAGPFTELEQLEAWLDGYLAGANRKREKGDSHITIKPASVKQGAH